MSFFAETLEGQKIQSVLADSEVTYIMLSNGAQVTIRGVVVVEPRAQSYAPEPAAASAR